MLNYEEITGICRNSLQAENEWMIQVRSGNNKKNLLA